MNLIDSLEKHIKNLKNPLRDEDEILIVLKKRLTKKELKAFMLIEDKNTLEDVSLQLHCDDERTEEIYATVIKKLNQEKLKQELMQ
ncbi:MAG: hypothetical protein U9N30_07330 [Campylobacterota bacterium]|nr:hypothetical protein [Campylobacterota bacterium]